MKKRKNKCKNTSKTKMKAAVCIIFALLLIIGTITLDYYFSQKGDVYIIILINALPAIASIIGISGAWELFGKKSFAEEVLELSKVSDSYIKSGIVAVYDDFNDIEWGSILENVEHLTLFFVYAYSWRSRNYQYLEKLKNKGTKIRVILPDIRKEVITNSFDYDFGYGKYANPGSGKNNKFTKELIFEAIDHFRKLDAEIFLYPGSIRTTYYLIDETCVMAPFNHSGQERFHVPAVICKLEGNLYEFCKKDLEYIINQSTNYSSLTQEDLTCHDESHHSNCQNSDNETNADNGSLKE